MASNDPALAFLSKVPDQVGYLAICDGAVVKSDGDLANKESIARIAEKMIATVRSENIPSGKYQQLTVNYGTYLFVIVHSGKYIYVVKRKPSATA